MMDDHWVGTELTPGPCPTFQTDNDPSFVHRPIGFMARLEDIEFDPKTWEGDQA